MACFGTHLNQEIYHSNFNTLRGKLFCLWFVDMEYSHYSDVIQALCKWPRNTGISTKALCTLLVLHYCDVIMGAMASQITSLAIVYSTVYSGADHRKHQSSVSLAFVRGIHRLPVNSRHKWPVTRKMFPSDDVIMLSVKPIGDVCTSNAECVSISHRHHGQDRFSYL